MAPSDLLSTIHGEIEARLAELRPLLSEYEQLLAAVRVLDAGQLPSPAEPRGASSPAVTRRSAAPRGARGSAAGAIRRAASGPARTGRRSRASSGGATRRKPRASRGAAREAILAALEHGSHTIGELAMVTAMSTPNISGNVRRLLAEGIIARTERDGRTAYALA